jgi:exopolysaccharide biosynthesis polyprenyl glycosylphosphotransferase
MHSSRTDITLFMYQIADLAAVSLALAALYAASVADDMPNGVEAFLAARLTVRNALLCGCFLLFWNIVCRTAGLYAPACLSYRKAAPRVASACFVGAAGALMFPIYSISGLFSFSLVFWFLIVVTVTHLGVRFGAEMLRNFTHPVRKILIAGSGALADRARRELAASGESHVIGYVDSRKREEAPAGTSPDFLGRIDELDSILMHHVVDQVLIALPIKSCYDRIQCVIETCERVGVPAAFSYDLFAYRVARASVADAAGAQPMVHLAVAANDGRLIVKRLLDVTVAASALVLLSPVLATIAVLVKLTNPGPVLFVQERYGMHKRRFRMLKFRTMVVDAETLQAGLERNNEASGPVFKIRNDPRTTRLGRILRKTSLDELPQLINVLVGDMSLVGPRPLPVRDVARFQEPWLMRRFCVKPGLTCLWQISGRSNTAFDYWIRMDLEYIDNWSLSLDVEILARTLPAVIRGTGAA